MAIIWCVKVDRIDPETNDWVEEEVLIEMDEARDFDLIEAVNKCFPDDHDLVLKSALMIGVSQKPLKYQLKKRGRVWTKR